MEEEGYCVLEVGVAGEPGDDGGGGGDVGRLKHGVTAALGQTNGRY